jgi:short-chain fatty acids transporter
MKGGAFMFKKFTNGCVGVVNRWLPDPFLFAIILTILTFVCAMFGTQQKPLELLSAWGSDTGMWGLLSFSMQMALVLVLGSAMASASICKKVLGKIASVAWDKRSAILIVTFVSAICCWLNWGFGLIAGTLLAKEVAKRVKDVDYPLLIA